MNGKKTVNIKQEQREKCQKIKEEAEGVKELKAGAMTIHQKSKQREGTL